MSATIWVSRIEEANTVQSAMADWLDRDPMPCFTLVEASLVNPGKLIEVGLICRRNLNEMETAMAKIERLVQTPRISRIVKYGDLVFLAGVTAPEPDPDPQRQVRQVLSRIDDFLAQGGSDKEHILSATVWLADARYADAMNAAWDEWVSRDNPPARATVEARLVSPQLLVEIGIIAAPSSRSGYRSGHARIGIDARETHRRGFSEAEKKHMDVGNTAKRGHKRSVRFWSSA